MICDFKDLESGATGDIGELGIVIEQPEDNWKGDLRPQILPGRQTETQEDSTRIGVRQPRVEV